MNHRCDVKGCGKPAVADAEVDQDIYWQLCPVHAGQAEARGLIVEWWIAHDPR